MQFGELRLPSSPPSAKIPVILIVHGGCWADQLPGKHPAPDYALLEPLAAALTVDGIATWNIEYRRSGSPDGAWPATYVDLAAATDYLRKIAPTYNLDLSRVTVVGHSSGGQLALWLAARPKLPPTSDVYTKNPLPLEQVIDLDGPPELTAAQPLESKYCPIPAITQFVGGAPAQQPDRYRNGSAQAFLPLGIPQIIVTAGLLQHVGTLATDYKEAAEAKGDTVTLVPIDGNHFEIIDPSTPPGKAAIATILAAVKSRK